MACADVRGSANAKALSRGCVVRGVRASGGHLGPDGRKMAAEQKAGSRSTFGAENQLFIPSFSFPETEVELTDSKTHCPGSHMCNCPLSQDADRFQIPGKFALPLCGPHPASGRRRCTRLFWTLMRGASVARGPRPLSPGLFRPV